MIDIAAKLFPNILTILAQLGATFVIYLMYKKFVHQHVVAYLDRQSAELEAANTLAKTVREEAEANRVDLEKQRLALLDDMAQLKVNLMNDAQRAYDAKMQEAHEMSQRKIAEAEKRIEREKETMIKDVEMHASVLAYEMSRKALENFGVSEAGALETLQRKLEHNAKV